MFSGSTQGVTNDRCRWQRPAEPRLGAGGRGLSFVGYSEGLPSTGSTVCGGGGYARKHNPWVDFAALPASVNQSLSALPSNFAALPTVAFVVPNLCHDTHDCSVGQGDGWLRSALSGYAAWAQSHNSLLVVTYDEDDDTAANHIPDAAGRADGGAGVVPRARRPLHAAEHPGGDVRAAKSGAAASRRRSAASWR